VVEIYSLSVMVEMQAVIFMVKIDCTCYGGDIRAVPVTVEINRLYMLWWR
jgi:hypothetical protein